MNIIRNTITIFICLFISATFAQNTAKTYAPNDFMTAVSKEMNNAKFMLAKEYTGTNSALVQNVVARFNAQKMTKDYHIYVMEVKEWNAFASAGMSSPDVVCIWTGLLNDMKTEDELAGVVAHEITHNNHQDASSEMAKLTAVAVLNSILFGDDKNSGTMQGLLLLFMQKGFSRTQEYRADREGLVMAVKAGYDPRATVNLWNKMADKYPSGDIKLLLDHPASKDRADTLDKIVKNNMQQGADGKWTVVSEPQDLKNPNKVGGRFGKSLKSGLFTGLLGLGYGGIMIAADNTYTSADMLSDSGKWALSGFAVSMLFDVDLPALKNKNSDKSLKVTVIKTPNGGIMPGIMANMQY